jgi:two-component system OmpR family sensor kinase
MAKSPGECPSKESLVRQTDKSDDDAARSPIVAADERDRAIAERDQTIAELREAVRSRDDFLAIAAHELRNPLTPILLCVKLIRIAENSGDRTKAAKELDRLERQIKHFVARTQMLLEVGQITSHKFQAQRSSVNLSELVAGLISDYEQMIARSGSTIVADIEDGVVGNLDRMALSEIVENLLSNAIKYGQRNPIELYLKNHGAYAQLSVRDHGIGIAGKDKDRIFERFERAVSKDVRTGFGIGLWLTRNLVEAMGGSILVEGTPGEGSVFIVTLPLKNQENNE